MKTVRMDPARIQVGSFIETHNKVGGILHINRGRVTRITQHEFVGRVFWVGLAVIAMERDVEKGTEFYEVLDDYPEVAFAMIPKVETEARRPAL